MSRHTLHGKLSKTSNTGTSGLTNERKKTSTYTNKDEYISHSDLVCYKSKLKYNLIKLEISSKDRSTLEEAFWDLSGFEQKIAEKELDLAQFMNIYKSGLKLCKNFAILYRSKSESLIVTKMRTLDELDYTSIYICLLNEKKEITKYKLNSWNDSINNFKFESCFENLFINENSDIRLSNITISLYYDYNTMSELTKKKLDNTRIYLMSLNKKIEVTRKEMTFYNNIVQGIELNANEPNYQNFIFYVNKMFLTNLNDEHDSSVYQMNSTFHAGANDRSYSTFSSSKNVFRNRILSRVDLNTTRLSNNGLNTSNIQTNLNESIYIKCEEKNDICNFGENNDNLNKNSISPLISDRIKQIVNLNMCSIGNQITQLKKRQSLQSILNFSISFKTGIITTKFDCAREYLNIKNRNFNKKHKTVEFDVKSSKDS